MRRAAVAFVALLLVTACASKRNQAAHRAFDVRAATAKERHGIAAAAKSAFSYESDPEPYRPRHIGVSLSYRFRLRHLRPRVVRARISRADARFAAAIVELRGPRGRRRAGTEVLLLERDEEGASWLAVGESGTGFVRACTIATPKPVRDLVCPSPWSVLRYPRPRVKLNRAVTMPVGARDVSRVDWKHVLVPGVACGASHEFRLRRDRRWGDAFVPSAELPWWPAVVVASDHVHLGDLDGDGRDEAVLDLSCSNAGGTAAGQLAFASVVYRLHGHTLSSVGVITPQQPFDGNGAHVPLEFTQIRHRKLIAHEGWYGAYDGTCCPSGQAKTTWTMKHGRLLKIRTTVIQKTWASTIAGFDVVAEPGDYELDRGRSTTVVLHDPFGIRVTLENLGAEKRDLRITLTIRQGSSVPVVRTRTIHRLRHEATASFSNLGRLDEGKATATLAIGDRGAYPLRYRIRFRKR